MARRGRKPGTKITRKGHPGYRRYIHKLLKNSVLHGQHTTISRVGMTVMNSFTMDMLQKIGGTARDLMVTAGMSRMTVVHMKTGASLVLPGDIFNHASKMGLAAVSRFQQERPARTKEGKGRAAGDKGSSHHAGLVFPVARTRKFLKRENKSSGKTAAVYLAGVLQYLNEEVLSLAHDEAKNRKLKKNAKGHRITSRLISLAVQKDSETKSLFRNVIIAKSGVIPHIQPALYIRSKKHKKHHSSESKKHHSSGKKSDSKKKRKRSSSSKKAKKAKSS